MRLPPTSLLRQYDTHRLIPARYSEAEESVLARLADSDRDLQNIFDLDGATNDRLLAEHAPLPGISIHELVFGVPYYWIVNAAFLPRAPAWQPLLAQPIGVWKLNGVSGLSPGTTFSSSR